MSAELLGDNTITATTTTTTTTPAEGNSPAPPVPETPAPAPPAAAAAAAAATTTATEGSGEEAVAPAPAPDAPAAAPATENGTKGDEKDSFYKVLVIGDYAVGKTSLIKRYTEGVFTPNYKLTIGVDFAVKKIPRDSGDTVTVQLWDIAGHERFGTMTRVYYKYAIAAVIVYDIQRVSTFEAVLKWKEDVDSKVKLPNGERIPCLLLANKCDLPGSAVDEEALNSFCQANGFIGWYATSALANEGIDKAMKFLAEKIVEVAATCAPIQKPADSIELGEADDEDALDKESKKGCC